MYSPSLPYISSASHRFVIRDSAVETARRNAISEVVQDRRTQLLDAIASASTSWLKPRPDAKIEFFGKSIECLYDLLMICITHCLGVNSDDAPIIDFDQLATMQVVGSISMDSFLEHDHGAGGRSYRKGFRRPRVGRRHGPWQEQSSGLGVERSTFEFGLAQFTSDPTLCVNVGSYVVPSFPAVHTVEVLRRWTSQGVFYALYLLYFQTAPVPLSPFFLLAVMAGPAALDQLRLGEISAFDPELADTLRPWFDLDGTQPKPTGPNMRLMSMLASLNIPVSDLQVQLSSNLLTSSSSTTVWASNVGLTGHVYAMAQCDSANGVARRPRHMPSPLLCCIPRGVQHPYVF